MSPPGMSSPAGGGPGSPRGQWPHNRGTVTLRRHAWTLPETVPFGDTVLKPLRGGEELHWRMQ